MSALKRGGKKAFFCNDIAKAKIIGGVQSVLFQEGNFETPVQVVSCEFR